MDGTIYDDGTRPLFAFDGVTEPARADVAGASSRAWPASKNAEAIAVICNPRSHRNKRRPLIVPDGVIVKSPRTRPDLRRTLAAFARDGVSLIVVAGGDGTVRDVLTCGADIWAGDAPTIGVLPCGKTNALAIDLGVPDDWDIARLIGAWRGGSTVARSPIAIGRPGENNPVFGFLFGAGVFVDATEMAQTTHRFGAVNNLAVSLSIAGGVLSTVFGSEGSPWRRGKRMAIRYDAQATARHGAALDSECNRAIMLASTMERLPLDVSIFGERRSGLKTLVVDAPPRRFLTNFLRVVRGKDMPSLERDGIHRVDANEIYIDLEGGFVLDGERFPAGRYILREASPIQFVTT